MKRSDRIWKILRYAVIAGFSITVLFFIIGIEIGFSYLVEFVAGSFGVFMGFLFVLWAEAKKGEDRVPELVQIICNELERIKEIAPSTEARHLPTQVWTSLVNAGDSALLPTEIQERLYDIYADVAELNIQHEREREANDTWSRTGEEKHREVYVNLAIPNREAGTNLRNKINNLLNSDIIANIKQDK
jgi:hypothetical protein